MTLGLVLVCRPYIEILPKRFKDRLNVVNQLNRPFLMSTILNKLHVLSSSYPEGKVSEQRRNNIFMNVAYTTAFRVVFLFAFFFFYLFIFFMTTEVKAIRCT